MNFWQRLSGVLLGLFGFDETESPRSLLDIALAVLAAFGALILIVYCWEKQPSPELRKAAMISAVLIIAALVFSKRRLAVLLGIVAVVGFRGLVAATLYGAWQGWLFAAAAGIAIYLGAKFIRE